MAARMGAQGVSEMLKLVPFSAAWITHDKLDLKAIYRRPRYVEDAYGEMHRELTADGLPAWDLTGPLPVKSHNKYEAKGFEYVTLADRDSLATAAAHKTIMGDWRDYIQDPRTSGPWHYRKYLEGQVDLDKAAAERLRADIERFGAEAVEAIRQQTDPTFRLPASLKGDEPAAAPKRGPGRPRKAETSTEAA
jgi:hypothetical protein